MHVAAGEEGTRADQVSPSTVGCSSVTMMHSTCICRMLDKYKLV